MKKYLMAAAIAALAVVGIFAAKPIAQVVPDSIGLNVGGAFVSSTNPFPSRALSWTGAAYEQQFACVNSAPVAVTAAATTEVVALTAAQQIRVCSFSLTISTAGTAKFVYGTGTNCGTGTADITGAMNIATGGNLTNSLASGGAVFRAPAANAVCLAAVTGNVAGVVTYAKF